jgi:protein-tyrosine phosphatase
MIDFHNHILPNVDDGSKSLEMSIDMIRDAQIQGITEIVNTTHHMHPMIDNSLIEYKDLKLKYSELEKILNEKDIDIKIHKGSEVYFHDKLDEIEVNDLTTFGNGRYMLIEFPVIQFPENYSEILFKLQLNGITPIIAHPERYRDIQKNINIIDEFIDKGYVVQIDAGSILGQFGKKVKKCALEIIRKEKFHLIGSDAHNYKRNFCIQELLDLNINIINLNRVNIFVKNPGVILKGKSVNDLQIDSVNISSIKKYIKRFLRFK